MSTGQAKPRMDRDLTGSIQIHIPEGTGRGYKDLTLTSGDINWQAEELFWRSRCHWLSGAMMSYTGWDIIVFDHRAHWGEWTPAHSGVLTPTGDLLDILGRRPIQDVKNHYVHGIGGETRHRIVPGEHMPGNVLTGIDEHRGDRFWWAREHSDEIVATYQHFARLVLVTNGYGYLFTPEKDAPPKSDSPARPGGDTKNTKTQTGGSMSSVQDIRQLIGAAHQRAQGAAKQAENARTELEEATGLLVQATDGSHSEEITSAVGELNTIIDELQRVPGRVQVAGDGAMAYAERL